MGNLVKVKGGVMSVAKRKPIFGVGINDSDYLTSSVINGKLVRCPFYRKWVDMIQRCYSSKYQEKNPTYIGCRVFSEWLVFSNFKFWMIRQDWEGNQLDKDLLVKGNKIYGPDTCVFVSRMINNLLSVRKNKNNKQPQGVVFRKVSGRYTSRIVANGVHTYLGCYATAKEAHEAYKIAKYEIIKQAANNQPEPLKSALLNHKITNATN